MTRRRPVTCAAPGCPARVQRGQLMCEGHWSSLPPALRAAVVRTRRAVERWAGSPIASRQREIARYGDAVREARDWFDAPMDAFGHRHAAIYQTENGRYLRVVESVS